jgi:hypothetical protein
VHLPETKPEGNHVCSSESDSQAVHDNDSHSANNIMRALAVIIVLTITLLSLGLLMSKPSKPHKKSLTENSTYCSSNLLKKAENNV